MLLPNKTRASAGHGFQIKKIKLATNSITSLRGALHDLFCEKLNDRTKDGSESICYGI